MLGKVTRWSFIHHLGWVIYHGEGQLVCRFYSMGSGLMPQIHISHKSDVLMWVSSGWFLVATPRILKNAIARQHIYAWLLFKIGAQTVFNYGDIRSHNNRAWTY